MLVLSREAMTKLDSILKRRDITLLKKVCIVKAMVFHVQMWELDHKEDLAPKNWCFWIVLEETLESPLDCTEIKPVNPKGNQSWIFTEGLMLMLELQYFGHMMGRAMSWEEPTHWKRPWCWKRLRARGEGGDRGWNGWIVSLTQWTWV